MAKTAPIFLLCRHCGNMARKIVDSGVAIVCCGEPMEVLTANTTDGAREKHVPACTREGSEVRVRVGSVAHPMLPEHHIGRIWLETARGSQCRPLRAGDEPTAVFMLTDDDEPVAVYEWCNLHGLWKVDIAE